MDCSCMNRTSVIVNYTTPSETKTRHPENKNRGPKPLQDQQLPRLRSRPRPAFVFDTASCLINKWYYRLTVFRNYILSRWSLKKKKKTRNDFYEYDFHYRWGLLSLGITFMSRWSQKKNGMTFTTFIIDEVFDNLI